MDYFIELGVQVVWFNLIYDMKNYMVIDFMFGIMEDFDKFIKEVYEKGIKVIMGFVLNYFLNKYLWFLESKKDGKNFY